MWLKWYWIYGYKITKLTDLVNVLDITWQICKVTWSTFKMLPTTSKNVYSTWQKYKYQLIRTSYTKISWAKSFGCAVGGEFFWSIYMVVDGLNRLNEKEIRFFFTLYAFDSARIWRIRRSDLIILISMLY